MSIRTNLVMALLGTVGVTSTVPAATIIYDSQGFENFTVGTVKGQNSWTISNGLDTEAVVQEGTRHAGQKALEILPSHANPAAGRVIARLSRNVSANHYLDFWVKAPAEADDYVSNANINFRGTNAVGTSNLILFTIGMTKQGTISGVSGARYDFGEWNRITAYIDLVNDTWDLWVNDDLKAENQPFSASAGNAVQVNRYDFDWTAVIDAESDTGPEAGNGYYVDNLTITDTNPVPEPAGLGALVVGAAGAMMMRRRRRRVEC